MPEDNAHKVLDIYAYFESKPGEVLLSDNFVAIGTRRHWLMNDLQAGIEQAERSGWIEAATRGWRLTENGYREAIVSHDPLR